MVTVAFLQPIGSRCVTLRWALITPHSSKILLRPEIDAGDENKFARNLGPWGSAVLTAMFVAVFENTDAAKTEYVPIRPWHREVGASVEKECEVRSAGLCSAQVTEKQTLCPAEEQRLRGKSVSESLSACYCFLR
ncbi:hypothetical protein NDU88_001022 [Pleurodeles waltl]|uniref:Uncharacterized protein n=1 Tax=Pleurodeles waltl TaxID=8319 RepID=A0AAV7SYR1_PLEWA|nr:hypothetical protein NDU88_001022 [Pleurodeles waltl]